MRNAPVSLFAWAFACALVASPLDARPADVGTRCQTRKLASAGRYAHGVLQCHAVAARAGEAVRPECLEGPRQRLTDDFASAESRGTCVTSGDAPTVLSDIDNAVGWVLLLVPRPPGTSICTARRLDAAGRYATTLFHIYAREHLHPTAPPNELPVRHVKANVRYLNQCFPTAALPDCGPSAIGAGPCDALSIIHDLALLRAEGRLFPQCGDDILAPGEECDINDAPACRFSCNTDCTCPHCGDNEVNRPGEQCDGTDRSACGSSPCQGDCTCPPSMCGDDRVNQSSEQCDGTDSAACPARCQSDCTCPAPVCGNGVIENGEECEGPSCFSIYACGAPDGPAACLCCAEGVASFSVFPPPCCDGNECRVFGPHECTCDPSFRLPAGAACGVQVPCCAGLSCAANVCQ